MVEDKQKELMCTNRYCYMNYRHQKIMLDASQHEEFLCENCGFELEPWKDKKQEDYIGNTEPRGFFGVVLCVVAVISVLIREERREEKETKYWWYL